MAYPDVYTDYPALITLQNIIYANCESTKIVFCLPWAYEDGMTWVEGWTDTFVDMQIHIYENTLQYSDDIGFEIAPVGWAWKTVLEEANFPLHYLHLSDWNHPSLRGSYIMACVIFSTIFLESSVDINYFADLPEDEANDFQIVASNTVLDNLELWNITTTDSETVEISSPFKFNLYQNYPNPFNPITEIRFTLALESSIKLNIYNVSGQLVKTLVDDNYNAGCYAIQWNGRDNQDKSVSSGIYFYRIKAGDYIETRSMVMLK